jgi:hypothetical protein
MNPSKRAILHGAMDVIVQIAKDEAQDLKDMPDNIENAEASDNFRSNVKRLKAASGLLYLVINDG